MPSECPRKDDRRRVAPLRARPAAVSLQPRSVAPVPQSGLRVFAGASSLGRRGERLAVAVGTSPGPGRAAHDSRRGARVAGPALRAERGVSRPDTCRQRRGAGRRAQGHYVFLCLRRIKPVCPPLGSRYKTLPTPLEASFGPEVVFVFFCTCPRTNWPGSDGLRGHTISQSSRVSALPGPPWASVSCKKGQGTGRHLSRGLLLTKRFGYLGNFDPGRYPMKSVLLDLYPSTHESTPT